MKDLYSKKYNIRFYNAPKNSMTSMIRMLGLDWVEVGDMPNDHKVCVVIREPYDRFISAFLQTKTNTNSCFNGGSNSHAYRDISLETLTKIFKSDPEVSVREYINEIKINGFFDNHQLTQEYYFGGCLNRDINKIDIYIDFKDLENEAIQKIDKDIKMFRLNTKSPIEKKRYGDLFEKYREDIINLYKNDTILYEKYKQDEKKV
jgi:hypothetical protein